MPTRSSSSASPRPANGVPIATSSVLANRPNNTANAACTTMNNVALCSRATRSSPACNPASITTATFAPGERLHRRPRPIRRQIQLLRQHPPTRPRQYANCRAITDSGSSSVPQHLPLPQRDNPRTAPATAPTPAPRPATAPHTPPSHPAPTAPSTTRHRKCDAPPPPARTPPRDSSNNRDPQPEPPRVTSNGHDSTPADPRRHSSASAIRDHRHLPAPPHPAAESPAPGPPPSPDTPCATPRAAPPHPPPPHPTPPHPTHPTTAPPPECCTPPTPDRTGSRTTSAAAPTTTEPAPAAAAPPTPDAAPPDLRLHPRRQPRHRRRLEHHPHRHPRIQRRTQPRRHLRRDQRIPTQLEEIVVHTRPDSHARAPPRTPPPRPPPPASTGARNTLRLEHRRRQRPPIQLPVRRQRQLRPAPPTPPAPCTPAARAATPARRTARRRGSHRPSRHHIADQAAPPGAGPSRTTTAACATSGCAGQRGLDLAELDPEPAQLHLEIGAAQILQLARRPVHRTRSPVRYIRSPDRAERVRHEPLRGQIRPAVVAARQLHTRQIQLARPPRAGPAAAARRARTPGVPLRARRSAPSRCRASATAWMVTERRSRSGRTGCNTSPAVPVRTRCASAGWRTPHRSRAACRSDGANVPPDSSVSASSMTARRAAVVTRSARISSVR